MGQCVSSRSEKGELARSKGAPPTKNPFKRHHIKMESKSKPTSAHTRGEAMSFGFKRTTVPPCPATNINQCQKNDTTSDNSLVNNQTTTARSGTPRLARPKKDSNGNCGTRTNRFGFRSPTAPLSNKVADSQRSEASSLYINYAENNTRPETKSTIKLSSGSNRSNGSDSGRSTSSASEDNNMRPQNANASNTSAPKPIQPATRFTLLTSHLPRPQFPVRLATAANYRSPDKSAKTAANNFTARKVNSENGNGSSASSVNDADSGVGSQKSGDLEAPGIANLEESPSVKNKLRNSNVKKARTMEMVFLNNEKKTFELRELQDSIEVTEIVPLQLPPLPNMRVPVDRGGIVQERARAYQQAIREQTIVPEADVLFSSDEEEEEEDGDEGFDDEGCGEEKQHRDRMLSEKDEKVCLGAGESEAEELWGHGEAMVGDDDLSTPSMAENNGEDVDKMNPPLRSVLLTIEDPAFATLAAMSTSTMIEDETSPDFSSSPPSSAAEMPVELIQMSSDSNKKNLAGGTPESPGTPTHASNSLSLSEGRDFLIDDEIADQPGLVFDETITANSSANTIVPHSVDDAVVPVDRLNTLELPAKTNFGRVAQLSHDCSPAHQHTSVGTLSPCESITSDDLMMDYDPSETSSIFGDVNGEQRLDATGLTEVEEAALRSDIEAIQNDEVLKELSSRLSAGMGNGVRATRLLRSRVGSSGSGGGESPRSQPLDTPRLRGSPLRPSRQGTNSPGEDLSEDSGIRLDRGTYEHMFQDVINIKTMLLRLKRVLQETDTVNAFENSINNGLYYNLGNDGTQEDLSSQKKESESVAEEIADLRRQVVFLQQQLEEKDRTISTLQESITRLKEAKEKESPNSSPEERTHETTNAATQTERVRPVSSGPSLLQGLPTDNLGGNLVSNTNENWTRSTSRPNETKSLAISSRVPVGPWRKQVAGHGDPLSRKLPSTPLPQRRKAS